MQRFKVIKEFRGPYVVLDLGAHYPTNPAAAVGSFTSKREADALATHLSNQHAAREDEQFVQDFGVNQLLRGEIA